MQKMTSTKWLDLFFNKPIIFTSTIISLVFAAYGLSLGNGYVWDDVTFIVDNPYVRDFPQWPLHLYFSHAESLSNDTIMAHMYRPIQTLSFGLDSLLWGDWAGGFHLTSILLHIGTCLAIVFAFASLVGHRASVIAAIIFSIHPAISEGVLSLSARGNQLYTFFLLLALGFFLKTNKPFDKNHFWSLLFGLVALFSKEPAIAFLVLLPIIQIFFHRPWQFKLQKSVWLYAPFVLIGGVFLLARALVVSSAHIAPYWGGGLWPTFLLQAKVYFVYLKLLIWPFTLQGRYSVPEVDALATVAVIANVGLILFSLWALRRAGNRRFFALAVIWFYVSLAPVSNIIPLPGAMMGERFIYFTFAGMLPLIIGSLDIQTLKVRPQVVFLLCVVVLATFLVRDMTRVPVWKDNFHFFKVLSLQEPNDPSVNLLMAKEELKNGDFKSALARLESIVMQQVTSPFPQQLTDLYIIYADAFLRTANTKVGNLARSGKFSLERRVKQIVLNPSPEKIASLYIAYGEALLLSNQPEEAYIQLKKASEISPFENDQEHRILLLQVEAAARSEKIDTALILLENALNNYTENDKLWNAYGNVLSYKGDTNNAMSAYREAIRINPSNLEARLNLDNLKGNLLR